MAKTLTIKLVKSPVCGVKKDQTATVRALGLHKISTASSSSLTTRASAG